MGREINNNKKSRKAVVEAGPDYEKSVEARQDSCRLCLSVGEVFLLLNDKKKKKHRRLKTRDPRSSIAAFFYYPLCFLNVFVCVTLVPAGGSSYTQDAQRKRRKISSPCLFLRPAPLSHCIPSSSTTTNAQKVFLSCSSLRMMLLLLVVFML